MVTLKEIAEKYAEEYGFEYDKIYEQTEYHFYDSNFSKIVNIKGNFYSEIDFFCNKKPGYRQYFIDT